MEELIRDIDRKVMGKFNKDLLMNTYFEHTDLFSPAAELKRTTGKFCGEVFRSKKYNIYWGEQKERCIHGYTNPVTKVHIPGPLYFHLNFTQFKILLDPNKNVSKRITTFPRFWPIHYFFLQDYALAREEGKNMAILKPRGTGWSELMATLGAWYYTFQTEDPVFYFAANDGYLTKEGIINKVWDRVNFLNAETERAFKHLRQDTDKELHLRASFIDPVTQTEKKTGGDILARIIDNHNKVRGARGHIFFEEGGSFPNLVKAWMTCWALGEQGGTTFANMILWGTGGEQGPGIAGLEDIFRNPEPYKCLEFENCWEEITINRPHGFFFPVWAVMDRFMDKWGNTDFEKAKAFHDKERELKLRKSPHLMDKHIAEYPYTPSEALMRLQGNAFPVAQLQMQLMRVDTNRDIQGLLKHGTIDIKEGEPQFILDPKVRPIEKYPHSEEEGVEGAFTMFEAPLKDDTGKVPDNLYVIVADCFAVDTEQATDWNSLGAFYVYKRKNNLFPTEDDMFVGWYSGRPRRVKDFYRMIFLAARLYNATVFTEIKGGGQGLLDYAREHGFLNYCGERPSVFSKDRESRAANRQYFVRMEEDDKLTYILHAADWMLKERALRIEGDKTQYVLNLEKFYDRAFLEELIKFHIEGNFDRVSCLLVLMAVKQELEIKEVIEAIKEEPDHIFNRSLFSDHKSSKGYTLSPREILRVQRTNNPTEMII